VALVPDALFVSATPPSMSHTLPAIAGVDDSASGNTMADPAKSIPIIFFDVNIGPLLC
jgi:hypothetical protein